MGICRTLLRWGADVYVEPTFVSPPVPSDVAHLLTKHLAAPFDLLIQHSDPDNLGISDAAAQCSDVKVAWSMWEFGGTKPLARRASSFAKRMRHFDMALMYDQVAVDAWRPHGPRRLPWAVLQGGYEAGEYKYYGERDWYGERFMFAQPLDCKVLTPSGWRLMRDLVVGDEVLDPEGGVQRVEKIWPRGELDRYRVRMTDGSETYCSEDHLWQVRKTDSRHPDQWRTVPLSEITRSGVKYRNDHRWALPCPRVDLPVAAQPLDPYMMGLLLGDGSLGHRPGDPARFYSADPELVAELGRRIPPGTALQFIRSTGECDSWDIVRDLPRECLLAESKVRCSVSGEVVALGLCHNHYANESYHRRLGQWREKARNPVTRVLEQLGLAGLVAHEKFLPQCYEMASPEQRLAVLRGLMDTDGTVTSHAASFTSTSAKLAEGVRFLVRSLGGYASLYLPPSRPGQRQQHMVHVAMSDCPFLLERKAKLWSARQARITRPKIRRIASVECAGRAEMQCITVSGSGLYITDHVIPTHNCMNGQLHARKSPYVTIQAFTELKYERPGAWDASNPEASGFDSARLGLHTTIGDPLVVFGHLIPGMKVWHEMWEKPVLEEFYRAAHVLVAPSRGEGKNLPALEMMTTGGAVAATNWGGMTQWLSPEYAYPLDYTLGPTDAAYPDGAFDAKVSVATVKEFMWHAFTHRGEVREKAELAARVIPQMCDWPVVMERFFERVRDNVPGKGEVLYNKAMQCRRERGMLDDRQAV